MKFNENTYRMTLAHLPRWRAEEINNLLDTILYQRKISLEDFWKCEILDLQKEFGLTEKQANDILRAKEDLQKNAVIEKEMDLADITLISYDSNKYPEMIKKNLDMKYSPSLVYVKGDLRIFDENSIAIVGSRNVSEEGIEFTRRISKKFTTDNYTIVSGYARGVDRIALEVAIENNGMGIVVLPQGILTFKSGFKKLYPYIEAGKVLVLSAYPPNAGWSVGLAMGRNAYIYALAKKIYVAESGNKGGTWNGAINGLKKGRKIFVRKANPKEKCANNKLIEKGAIAVDKSGNPIECKKNEKKNEKDVQKTLF